MSCGNSGNLCCDKGSAEFGEHVFERGLVLVPVPGLCAAAGVEVVGVVAVQGVPDDDEAVDDESEGDGAFDCALEPVAGLADSWLLGIGRWIVERRN